MTWRNPFIVRIGNAGAFVALVMFGSWAPASAQAVPAFEFAHQRVAFSRIIMQKNEPAVALRDPGLQSLLAKLGASITWQPGERYILLTTAEPRIVSFAIGDPRYDAGDLSSVASFAPYTMGGDAYLPLNALLHALYIEPKSDRGVVVLQPEIAAANVQSDSGGAKFVLHAALPLRPSHTSMAGNSVTYTFEGFGTTLERTRKFRSPSLTEIDVQTSGTVRDPQTMITIVTPPGTRAGAGTAGDNHDFAVTLGNAIAAEPQPPAQQSTAAPMQAAPAPTSASSARVSSVQVTSSGAAQTVAIAVDGNATFDWHRLRDNRWYVDIHDAALASRIDDQNTPGSVQSVRVRQLNSSTVRVALTVSDDNRVDVAATEHGLNLNVGTEPADEIARSGSGSIGSGAVAYGSPSPQPSGSDWKFSPSPAVSASTNPRLIVIDPGHGGSDAGAQRADLTEKTINLDISSRLRSILVARGWEVQMTRTSDVDVYAANDSAHDELQARVDVANKAGARAFVSVHTNSFSNSGPSGTTTYYYKAADLPLANAVHRRFQSESLGTKDDGVIKNNFYVVVHTSMPAILVETAFLSNPDDLQMLHSPAFLQKVAQAIADGIGDYCGSPSSAPQNSLR